MGDIIIDLRTDKMPTQVFIDRRVDDVEIQKLQFTLDKESYLSTETGNFVTLSGRDENDNRIEVRMDVTIDELKEALEKLLGSQ